MKIIKIKDVDEKVYEHICTSGLKVYVWPYELSEEISMSLTVKYGSVDTTFKVNNKKYDLPNGIAHFLEHIKFNEKKDVTAHDYFYKLGSYTNAYTTYDHTSYEVVCNENINDNLTHLLYFVLNPYFTKELVEKEKGIIVEECKMTLDNPYNLGYQTLLQNIYKNNKKRNLVTGLEEEVKTITLEDAKAVFDNFYHPENMFLTVTGKVNPYEVVKIVDNFFEKNTYDKYEKPKMIVKKEVDDINKKSDSINTNVTKEKVFMSYKIPKKNFKGINDMNLRILFNIILANNFGTTSEFNDYLLKNDLIDDIFYNTMIEKEHVVIMFELSSSYPKEVIKEVRNKFNKLTINEKDFIRKSKSLVATSILGFEDANDVNMDIRMDLIKYGKITTNLKGLIESLTLKDSENVIKNIKDYKESFIILNPLEFDKKAN